MYNETIKDLVKPTA